MNRLFFAMETHAPWPAKLPNGRILTEDSRHMTLAFLGEVDLQKLVSILTDFPQPDFEIGFGGIFDKCQFLPERHPNVVSWHLDLLEEKTNLLNFQRRLVAWLRENNYVIREHSDGFLPHITVARQPFDMHDWKKNFHPLPAFVKDIHLYESVGNLQYEPRWSYPLLAPLQELDHTADVAFLIRGSTIPQLLQNSYIALAFIFPQILSYKPEWKKLDNLDDVVICLNESVTKADAAIGCPFKAVSFHGEIREESDGILQWEMIIDV